MKKMWKLMILYAVVMLSVTISATSANIDNRLHIAFLDVGQGDAILIRTPAHQTILIDGGPGTIDLNVELGKLLPFWDHKIDLIICTQPHSDHVSGLVDVVRRYEVEKVVGFDMPYDSSTYGQWLKLVDRYDIDFVGACAGQRLNFGEGLHLDIIHPQQVKMGETSSDIDNNGVVSRLAYKEISFLFTADIRYEAEQRLIDLGYMLKSDVLKVAHHGSDTSSTAEFITAVNPSLAIICVGENNRFSHPDDEVLSRLDGIQVMRTDEHGTVELITDGQTLWMQ